MPTHYPLPLLLQNYRYLGQGGGGALGDATRWPDVANFSALPHVNLRVGDRCRTLDTGYQWSVTALSPDTWAIVDAGTALTVGALPTVSVLTGAYGRVGDVPYVWTGTEWRAEVWEISSWEDRPLSGVADGQRLRYTPTGVQYRFAANIGEWFRDGFGTSFTLLRKLDGDKLPADETPVFATATTAPGTISLQTVSGVSYVEFNSSSGTAAAYAEIPTAGFTTSTRFHCVGYAILASLVVSGATDKLNGLGLRIANGGKDMKWIGPSQTLTNGWATIPNGLNRMLTVTAANLTWLECVSYGTVTSTQTGGIMLFANHSPFPCSVTPGGSLPNTSSNFLRLGDDDNTVGGRLRVRNWKFCTY